MVLSRKATVTPDLTFSESCNLLRLGHGATDNVCYDIQQRSHTAIDLGLGRCKPPEPRRQSILVTIIIILKIG